MIYNQELTDNLKEIFGNEVENWSKPIIRNKLEDKVDVMLRRLLDPINKPIRGDLFNIYEEVKELDNQFTELYIQELN